MQQRLLCSQLYFIIWWFSLGKTKICLGGVKNFFLQKNPVRAQRTFGLAQKCSYAMAFIVARSHPSWTQVGNYGGLWMLTPYWNTFFFLWFVTHLCDFAFVALRHLLLFAVNLLESLLKLIVHFLIMANIAEVSGIHQVWYKCKWNGLSVKRAASVK